MTNRYSYTIVSRVLNLKVTELNNFATSSADLGEGLTKSASALNTAGVDLSHTLAMLTGGAEITQNANEFGSFLKIASMRIRGKLLCLHTRKVCMPCYA
ncbi:MAG: phage tail tape measure protein [Anaerobutyricum hallii]|uniref:phage tail tape measure protein n=1 Tax=Anaerobutyricum hallii TaxID=39488 RepID=UPI002A8051EC|nr:phage tail tape measure protein [Anaerobutyricum hallii]MDY4576812.1 phage tail tape measure protein [Anaerobutyricum hallii]